MRPPTHAKRIRPNRPEYGIFSEETAGLLTWHWVSSKMEKSRNYWICTTRPNGRPHAAPVWGVWLDSTLFFGTDRRSVKASNIKNNSHAVVHLESGDETLIFEGQLVESRASDEHKAKIARAYAQKYPSFDSAANGGAAVWYQLIPHKVMAWLERDYPHTVTHWVFDVGGLN